jgi:hypothetical protein
LWKKEALGGIGDFVSQVENKGREGQGKKRLCQVID